MVIIVMIMLLSNCNKSINNLTILNKGIENDLIDSVCTGNINKVINSLNNSANIDDKDDNGSTALMFASSSGHTEVVKLLIERGANINDKDNYGWTALMFASSSGHTEIVKLLLERGADINDKNNYVKTALMFAVEKEHREVIKMLIKSSFSINFKNIYGKTSSLYSSAKECIKILKALELLTKNGTNIKYKDRYGNDKYANTVLMHALINGHIEIVSLLIDNGYNVSLNEGNTALIYVVEQIRKIKDKEIRDKYIGIAYILIEAMIKYYSSLIDNTSDKIGVLTISEYIELLNRIKSLPRDIFIEIISYL